MFKIISENLNIEISTAFTVRATIENNPLDIIGIHPELFLVTPIRG